MTYRPDYYINLDDILESKGVKLPGFIKSFIKKFIHLDFINEFAVRGYEGVEFCSEAIKYVDVQLQVEGLENVPNDGTRYTFVSNHPLGGIDGIALGGIIGEKFGDNVTYLLNDFLMHLKGLATIGIPVNKTGTQSKELPRLINEAFQSDKHMILFPSGKCSRKINGKIQDPKWGKTFITKSKQSGRSIVPIHFVAENSKRFYRIANFCDSLKIKFNIAMLFLPDELYKNRHSTFKVIFGKPIPASEFDSSKTSLEWAQWIKDEIIYKL